MPRHPATHARLEQVLEAERRLDVAGLVELAVRAAERVPGRFPPLEVRAGAAAAS